MHAQVLGELGERQQLIGVRFATVTWDDSARSLRTVGKVTYDETRVAHVHPRIEGWIEQVFVDFTGDLVKKGSRCSRSTARKCWRPSRNCCWPRAHAT